jgi:hypothetical protein
VVQIAQQEKQSLYCLRIEVAKSEPHWHITCDLCETMSPRKSVLVLLIFAAASCGQNKMRRDQQKYDVVQEGSADTVTSTINAPGEINPPLTSSTITGTNVDTTTAFTLPGTVTGTTTEQPGTIAGSLPSNTNGFPSGYTPRPRPRPVVQPPTPPMDSSTSTASPPTTQTAPTATDSVAPTTTSTTDTTGTSSPTDQKQKKDKGNEKDTPPPPTDTTGTHG